MTISFYDEEGNQLELIPNYEGNTILFSILTPTGLTIGNVDVDIDEIDDLIGALQLLRKKVGDE